ncbi:hypothetical protein MRQ36_26855 [Micromonospora sp. R77]|uniref:hypothetical protein n=1 Tax=Micromonospora sp. R77 TaxID=2925836 RepID=UPI001F614AF5|nr:hypothetical protein [Micromonospora sp. R77]MCI4065974.1 hypothetical protein [Micromonospora sp. R77]
MTTDARLIAEAREGHARVSRCLLDARKLVDEEFGRQRPWTGASAAVERDARERLHRLGCLSLALDALVERIDEREQSPGGRAALARLLAEPCMVRFTAGTREPARDEALTVAEIVAVAGEQADRVGALVATQRSAVSSVAAQLARLRTDLEELAAPNGPVDVGPGRADGDRPVTTARTTGRPVAWPPCTGRPRPTRWAAPGPARGATRWPRSPTRSPCSVALRRRRPSRSSPPGPSGCARRYGGGALAAEATREGLGDGDDPTVGLPVDACSTGPAGAVRSDGTHGPPSATSWTGPPNASTPPAADCAGAATPSSAAGWRRTGSGPPTRGGPSTPTWTGATARRGTGCAPDGFTVTAASRAVRAYQQAVNGGRDDRCAPDLRRTQLPRRGGPGRLRRLWGHQCAGDAPAVAVPARPDPVRPGRRRGRG